MIVFDDRYWKRLIAITTRWFTCLNVYKFNDCESTACFDKKRNEKNTSTFDFVLFICPKCSNHVREISHNFACFPTISIISGNLFNSNNCAAFFSSTLCCDFTRDKFADFIIYNSNYYLIYYLMTVKEMHHHPLTN